MSFPAGYVALVAFASLLLGGVAHATPPIPIAGTAGLVETQVTASTEHGPNTFLSLVQTWRFAGDAEGMSEETVDITRRADGSGTFVSRHFITGSVLGRRGSLVLLAVGTLTLLEDGTLAGHARWVVQDATEDLTGLRGTGEIAFTAFVGGVYHGAVHFPPR